MKLSVYCAIVYLIVSFVADVCEATCDEYIIIFEEKTCPIYRLKPLTHEGIINFVGDTNDCNTADLYNKNKECLLEFDCMNKEMECINHVKPTNKQSHIVIPEVTTPHSISKRKLSDVNNNKTKDLETSNFDVHLIFENINEALNESTIKTKEIKMHNKIICKYAEIVCNDEGKLKNVLENTDSYFYDNSTIFIDISIDRDETSTIQPLFTGYFREQSKEPLSSYENDFKNLNTASLKCPLLNNDTSTCNMSKSIYAYINTTYIQNNTKTNYPNCTMDAEMINNTLNLICDNVTFGKYNKHLELTSKQRPSPMSDGKEKLDDRSWNCQIMEFKDILTAKEPDNNVSEIYFENCFRGLNLGSTNNNDKTEVTSSKPDILNKDNTSDTNPKKIIKITVTETANCTQNQTLNIQEGKFVNFEENTDLNNILKDDTVELNLANCIKVNNSKLNDSDKHLQKNLEITIFLKNYSLSASDLKLLNKTAKQEQNKEIDVREKLYLRCHSSNVSSNKTTKNTTALECETINPKDLIIQEDNSDLNQNTTQDLRSWNCQITEVKESLISKRKNDFNEIYFKDCFKGLSLTDNNTGNSKEEIGVTSSKPDMIKDNNTSDINSKKMIKIIITENTNCTQNSTLNIQEGKFFDFEINNDKNNILKNDVVELNLANCLKVNNSIVNGTDKLSEAKIELTIFLKNESLSTSDLKLLNKAAKQEQNKGLDGREKLYLRCDNSNVSSNKSIKNTTALECETIEPKDLKMLVNSTDSKDIEEKDKREILTKFTFNRKIDVNKLGKKEKLVGSTEVETIILITLAAIAGTSLLLLIVLRLFRKRGHHYNPTATREPDADEETAF